MVEYMVYMVGSAYPAILPAV